MYRMLPIIIGFLLYLPVSAQEDSFNGLGLNLGNLYRLSDAKTRSISPENLTGEKGKGGMATLEEGSAARAARDLGQDGKSIRISGYLPERLLPWRRLVDQGPSSRSG